MTLHVLGPKGATALEGRGLSLETAVRFRIYTGRAVEDGRVEPDEAGSVVVFPFVDRGEVVAEKYRAPGKRFWQRAGGVRTFWNADALDDPGLANGSLPLVITEGEIDAMTAVDCGFPLAVSVPDGAPSVKAGEDPEALPPADPDPEREATGKFEFLWRNRDRLRRVKRIILAVDSDPPGKRLAAELVRRLGPARCSFVTYPAGCKDLNDVLQKHGQEAATAVLDEAKHYPLKGAYRLSDYPPVPDLVTYRTGWRTLDGNMQLFAGEFIVVTGIPNHGKSTWVTHLLVNLAEQYGWRSAIFSPEMPIVPQYRDKIRRIRLRRPPVDERHAAQADDFIEWHFRFIDGSVEDLNEETTLPWVVERAEEIHQRDGLDVLVIDPWNEVEHSRGPHESAPDYIGRAIRMLKRFAKQRQIVVIVVAHPTKEVGKDGHGRMPTPYDVEGSAHWYNKPDHVVIVHRPDEAINETVIRIAKVRFEETGAKGSVSMAFNKEASRYEMLDWRGDR